MELTRICLDLESENGQDKIQYAIDIEFWTLGMETKLDKIGSN
jgi:hypothetical protein